MAFQRQHSGEETWNVIFFIVWASGGKQRLATGLTRASPCTCKYYGQAVLLWKPMPGPGNCFIPKYLWAWGLCQRPFFLNDSDCRGRCSFWCLCNPTTVYFCFSFFFFPYCIILFMWNVQKRHIEKKISVCVRLGVGKGSDSQWAWAFFSGWWKLQKEVWRRGDPGNQDAMSQVSKKVRNSDLDAQGEDEETQFSVWPITLKYHQKSSHKWVCSAFWK